MKKWYRVELNVVSTTWETCNCLIEAESEEEAREKFNIDPDNYDWDDWEHSDSEVRDWEVERIEYDHWYTKRMKEIKETKDEEV